MKTVSVVINCYNGEKFLEETLNSLSSQTFIDFELVFIDNCSIDCTPDIAKTFDSRLRYFKTNHNISLGEARNYALDRCEGKYIAFLDSDDLWEKDKLMIQVEQMEKEADCAITISNSKMLNMMTGTELVVDCSRKTGFIDYDDFAANYNFGLSSVMIRKEILKKMDKKFDTRLSYAEEFDMFLRLASYGKIYYYERALSTYRVHNTMHSLILKDSIPQEYSLVLQNLVEYIPNFTREHNEVVKRIEFLRDYTSAKLSIENKKIQEAHMLMKPYALCNKRALFFYLLTFLPEQIVLSVYKKYFTKKML